jgi:hypothetical protein
MDYSNSDGTPHYIGLVLVNGNQLFRFAKNINLK